MSDLNINHKSPAFGMKYNVSPDVTDLVAYLHRRQRKAYSNVIREIKLTIMEHTLDVFVDKTSGKEKIVGRVIFDGGRQGEIISGETTRTENHPLDRYLVSRVRIIFNRAKSYIREDRKKQTKDICKSAYQRGKTH